MRVKKYAVKTKYIKIHLFNAVEKIQSCVTFTHVIIVSA